MGLACRSLECKRHERRAFSCLLSWCQSQHRGWHTGNCSLRVWWMEMSEVTSLRKQSNVRPWHRRPLCAAVKKQASVVHSFQSCDCRAPSNCHPMPFLARPMNRPRAYNLSRTDEVFFAGSRILKSLDFLRGRLKFTTNWNRISVKTDNLLFPLCMFYVDIYF